MGLFCFLLWYLYYFISFFFILISRCGFYDLTSFLNVNMTLILILRNYWNETLILMNYSVSSFSFGDEDLFSFLNFSLFFCFSYTLIFTFTLNNLWFESITATFLFIFLLCCWFISILSPFQYPNKQIMKQHYDFEITRHTLNFPKVFFQEIPFFLFFIYSKQLPKILCVW